MKNSYRERILQEKKKLDPEQVFVLLLTKNFYSPLQTRLQERNSNSFFCIKMPRMDSLAGMMGKW